MSSLGEIVRIDAVKFVRFLPASPESVWAFLTETSRITAWYGDDGRIEPREGGTVWLMGGHIRGVVTQWKPGRKLAYTWNVFSPGETESSYPESYLTFEIKPDGPVTQLTLTHMPIPPEFSAQTKMGWHTYLDLVTAVAQGDTPQPRATYMKQNAELYGINLNDLPQ